MNYENINSNIHTQRQAEVLLKSFNIKTARNIHAVKFSNTPNKTRNKFNATLYTSGKLICLKSATIVCSGQRVFEIQLLNKHYGQGLWMWFATSSVSQTVSKTMELQKSTLQCQGRPSAPAKFVQGKNIFQFLIVCKISLLGIG
jgi:hypothetical protein